MKIEALETELQNLQAAHPDKSREVAKSLALVVEDIAKEDPDKKDVESSLERLKRRGEKIMEAAPKAVMLINAIINIVNQLPFMS